LIGVGQLQHLRDQCTDRLLRQNAGDHRSRAIERQNPSVQIGRRQPAPQTVDDVTAERLEIFDLVRRALQLRIRLSQPFRQVATQGGDSGEAKQVEPDRVCRQAARWQHEPASENNSTHS
jgi:hypothetical protein